MASLRCWGRFAQQTASLLVGSHGPSVTTAAVASNHSGPAYRWALLASTCTALGCWWYFDIDRTAIYQRSYCEEAIPSKVADCTEEEDDEEDPYAALPDEDEETDCTICNTFRKGPCRPYWRKLERCFKDNENSGSSKCTRYFMPHHECLSQYTNLYQLISLELKQELVHDTEHAVRPHERKVWDDHSGVTIDWTPFQNFQKEPAHLKQPPKMVQSDDGPYWRRLPADWEPLLVATTAQLPQVQNDHILKFAYLVDQDDIVIGLAYNDSYGKMLERTGDPATEENSDEKKENNSDEESSQSSTKEEAPIDLETPMKVEFYILPGVTQSVQVCGFYSEFPDRADPKEELLDVTLYKSQRYDLPPAAV